MFSIVLNNIQRLQLFHWQTMEKLINAQKASCIISEKRAVSRTSLILMLDIQRTFSLSWRFETARLEDKTIIGSSSFFWGESYNKMWNCWELVTKNFLAGGVKGSWGVKPTGNLNIRVWKTSKHRLFKKLTPKNPWQRANFLLR